MNKIFCSLVFALCIFSVHAQSLSDSREKIQLLAQKVDSLEHELSYLKLTYELNTLNSDITMFANEVYTRSIAIQLDLYNRNFNSTLGDSYQQYYEACKSKKQAMSELVEAKKTLFTFKVITFPYHPRNQYRISERLYIQRQRCSCNAGYGFSQHLWI